MLVPLRNPRFGLRSGTDRLVGHVFGLEITLARLIFTGVFGRSPLSVATWPIFLTTSRLLASAVLPKAEYCRSRCGTRSRQMKNCEPAELGSLVRAIESTPGSCGLSLNSARIV